MLTVHYEIYDGLPLISKWWTLERRPGWYADGYAAEQKLINADRETRLVALDGFVAPGTTGSPGMVAGWSTADGKLAVHDGKLELAVVSGGGSNAGARYLNASDSAGATLAPGSGDNGEKQSSIGLGLSGSGTSREDWEVMVSCDAGKVRKKLSRVANGF